MAAEFDSRRSRRWLTRLVIWTLVLAIVLGGTWTWFSLNWSYSEGERAGILQKFSRKGWLCKTYEGELALYIVGGVAPQIWHFSTRDPTLAAELSKNVGQDMRLQYSEHRGVPTNCFAETPYFASGFTLIKR
jgi:hypothetical protein